MTANDPTLNAIRLSLSKLVEVVCQQAETNDEFKIQLATALNIKVQKPKPRTKPTYNLFDKLKTFENNFELLQNDLLSQDKEELILLGIAYKIGKKKNLSGMENDELVKRLVQHAKDELSKWGTV